MKRFELVLFVVALVWTVSLDSTSVQAGSVPLDSERWKIAGAEHRFEEHLGRPALYLKAASALITDEPLQDGVLEFDVAFSQQRGFSGGIFRHVAPGNYEHFYLRPHQSGNPDALQYTPTFDGISAWQLYHGEGYGAPVIHRYDTWMQVKIVFSGTRGEVYIDSDEPVVTMHELKRPLAAGSFGITASNFAPAWFSNVSYSPKVPALKSPVRPAPELPPGSVKSWSVSTAFKEADLEGKVALSASDKAALEWVSLAADADGTANLAQARSWGQEDNTVFARTQVKATKQETRRMRFGYSDRVKVYLNGTLVYGGSNDYRSRDYRYLGTIGMFDELYLPLEEGTNELWFAVSESFGGWGLRCAIDPG